MVWYHGSQQRLSVLAACSSITEDRALAVAFSHRPSIVSFEDGRVRHNGTTSGFLHTVAGPLAPEDIYPHPHPINRDKWEWITTRDLPLTFVEQTEPAAADLLSQADIDALHRRASDAGQEGSAIL